METNVETDALEQLMLDDCGCESKHITFGCSGPVVARKTTKCRGLNFLICQASYSVNSAAIRDGQNCPICDELCADCWSVIPV